MASPICSSVRTSKRRLFAVLVIATAVAAPMIIAPNASAAKNRYGVVVEHGDNTAEVQCVKLGTEAIKAFDLLTRTTDWDFFVQYFSFVGDRAICWLDGEGTVPPDGCFDDPGGKSWSIWLMKKGKKAPVAASAGLSSLKVPAGAVLTLQFEGYTETSPGVFEQAPPATRSLKSIC